MKALLEVVKFNVNDVITTSGGGQAGDTCPDDLCFTKE